jgi:hypothetical protein
LAPVASRPQADELEALRLEIEALRKSLQATRDRVKTLEEEVRGLKAARKDEVGDGHTPGAVPNFVPTASLGGRDDLLIDTHGLRSARVVFSEAEAESLGLELDHDDSHAMRHGPDFALLIHGPQPAGSEASQAISNLRKQGEFGYGEKADAIRAQRRFPLTLAEGGAL